MRAARLQALPARRGHQLAIGAVAVHAHGDAEAVAQLLRRAVRDRAVPAADEHRGDRFDHRVQAIGEAALDAAQVGLRRGQVLLGREQQGHVDRHALVDRFLDRPVAGRRARDLDEQVAASGLRVDAPGGLDAAGGIVSQQRRDLHGHPAVDPAGGFVHGREQVRGAAQVLQRQLQEQRLAGGAGAVLLADAGVVGVGAPDRLVEDRRIRGQSCQPVLGDPAFEGPVVQHLPGDVVQPQALADGAQSLQVLVHCNPLPIPSMLLSTARSIPRADRAMHRRGPGCGPKAAPRSRAHTVPPALAGQAPGPPLPRPPRPRRRG